MLQMFEEAVGGIWDSLVDGSVPDDLSHGTYEHIPTPPATFPSMRSMLTDMYMDHLLYTPVGRVNPDSDFGLDPELTAARKAGEEKLKNWRMQDV